MDIIIDMVFWSEENEVVIYYFSYSLTICLANYLQVSQEGDTLWYHITIVPKTNHQTIKILHLHQKIKNKHNAGQWPTYIMSFVNTSFYYTDCPKLKQE